MPIDLGPQFWRGDNAQADDPDEFDRNFYPCGCLKNQRGAHRGDGSDSGPCPDFETVYPANGSTRLEDLTWRPRGAARGNP